METESPYAQVARDRKVQRLATEALLGTLQRAHQKVAEDPSRNLRVEQGAQLGLLIACLRGKHGHELALKSRGELLASTGVKGASPKTWRQLIDRLTNDYEMLAATPCENTDPFAGLP